MNDLEIVVKITDRLIELIQSLLFAILGKVGQFLNDANKRLDQHQCIPTPGSSALHRFPHAGQKNTMIFGIIFSMTATRSLH